MSAGTGYLMWARTFPSDGVLMPEPASAEDRAIVADAIRGRMTADGQTLMLGALDLADGPLR
jgi:hypothetical protein